MLDLQARESARIWAIEATADGGVPGDDYIDGILVAYLSALTPAEVGGLVERLQSWDHCWPAPGLENAVAEAASTLTTISARNAELEREVKRLREAVDLLETANSLRRNSMGDVNYDTFYDGPSVEDLEERAHALSTAPQGGDHGE